MLEASAVSVSPTWAVPVMVSAPVAGELAACGSAAGAVSQPAPVSPDSATETR